MKKLKIHLYEPNIDIEIDISARIIWRDPPETDLDDIHRNQAQRILDYRINEIKRMIDSLLSI